MPNRLSARIDNQTAAAIAAHAAADAAARGGKPNHSRSIAALVELARGNARSLRHDLQGDLNSIALHVAVARGATRQPQALQALDAISRSVESISRRLARPGGA